MHSVAGRLTLLPGDQIVTDATAGDGGVLSVTVGVRRRLRVGATAYPGAPTGNLLKAMPQVEYLRDFGKDRDGDKRPELPAHNSQKMTVPASVLVHVSWKDDVAQLSDWLDGLTRPVWLTWWHEPHGDMAPAAYRAEAGKVSRIVDSHPRRHLVLGHGPAVSRWWLVEKNGNPLDWWYPGANVFCLDAYNDHSSRYRSAEEMFGAAAAFARCERVPWLVSEYGLERVVTDKDGSGRVRAMREHVAWLRRQPDCVAVGWWDHGGDLITGLEPEQTVWRDLIGPGVSGG